MSNEMLALSLTAVSIGFLHTLFGPDHYLPFIMISKAKKWSLLKTSFITFICGIGHILSSVVLGIAGLLLGVAVNKLVSIESLRGEIAAWLLISFGLLYFVWGIKQAAKNKSHTHEHVHVNDAVHEHNHSHISGHVHIHDNDTTNITPWVLFLIFVFGPCEPLIPLVMYPAAKGNSVGVIAVTLIFGLITITTMLSIVVISYLGMSFIPFRRIEKYTHALAGAAIFLCGIAIQFMGL
ncbi:MAG: sulfite exporter TauE/SafE family protein [Elusimicrobia bacterium]|nr:sulfite exporter TauE/SafE family protein [Elusimicrobiota bacterium]